MTRKDYELFAKTLGEAYKLHAPGPHLKGTNHHTYFKQGYVVALHAVNKALKADNPNFDLERFMNALVKHAEIGYSLYDYATGKEKDNV